MDAPGDHLRPELDEAGAREDLAAHGKRSIRALARAWNWPASRVFRFLERIEAETPSETAVVFHEIVAETPDLFHEPAEPADGAPHSEQEG
jgi:hypothetical protein